MGWRKKLNHYFIIVHFIKNELDFEHFSTGNNPRDIILKEIHPKWEVLRGIFSSRDLIIEIIF